MSNTMVNDVINIMAGEPRYMIVGFFDGSPCFCTAEQSLETCEREMQTIYNNPITPLSTYRIVPLEEGRSLRKQIINGAAWRQREDNN